MRELMLRAKRIRDAAGRAYIEQWVNKRKRVIRRETDEEIRRVLRAHNLASPAFD